MAVVSGLQGQDPHLDGYKPFVWNRPNACIVDFVNTPCRTVHYHGTLVENQSWGVHDVTVRSYDVIEAVDQDGSESRTERRHARNYWLFPAQDVSVTFLFIRPQRTTVNIDHVRKRFESSSGHNLGFSGWETDDSQCSHAASHYLYLSGRLPDCSVAGIPVVGYKGRDIGGGNNVVYFAPSIGCQMLRAERISRNGSGLPTSISTFVVDSYTLGAPAQNLFTIPSGYKQVPNGDL
jgi:hypothetical protein